MRVVVIGAGVVGLATAYYLARDGHAVTIVDRNDGVALETSFANGAQLSYSYVAPLAGPGVLPKVPPWLLRRDSPLRFYPALDLAQWRWLLGFVAACNRETSERTTRRLLALASDSRRRMHAFVRDEAISFDHARNGKLVVYSDPAGFDSARRLLDYQRSLGSEQVALDRAACLAREPSLAVAESTLGRRLVGGIDTPSEEVGDCYRFCVGLERRLVQPDLGVRMLLGTLTRSLVVRGGRVTHADTAAGELDADAFVVAAGVESMMLCRDVGVRLPLYPLKGYSLTLPLQGPAPTMSITDFKRKVVYAPLADGAGHRLRVAGMADIAGWSRAPDPVRLRQLLAEARGAFPRATDYAMPLERFEPWCGLRPATPRGSPLLGATSIKNLYVNVGQGALGWTLALASGGFVADVMAGRPTAVPGEGLTL
ncbi:MAG: D-amino acid dehydrogenase [Proteobacteria bacterium]|nr:D-amino acid dehydrogenase [Pseudomonadota bacterium]